MLFYLAAFYFEVASKDASPGYLTTRLKKIGQWSGHITKSLWKEYRMDTSFLTPLCLQIALVLSSPQWTQQTETRIFHILSLFHVCTYTHMYICFTLRFYLTKVIL